MKFLKLIPILILFWGSIPYKNFVYAEVKNPKDYKVLSNDSKKISISKVEYFIKQGDKHIKNGDLDQAKNYYLDARKLAKATSIFLFRSKYIPLKELMQEYQKKCKVKVRKHYKFWQNQMKD